MPGLGTQGAGHVYLVDHDDLEGLW